MPQPSHQIWADGRTCQARSDNLSPQKIAPALARIENTEKSCFQPLNLMC